MSGPDLRRDLPISGPDLRRDLPGRRGWQRLHAELNAAKFAQDTPEYDEYVLSLKADPADPEYSQLLNVVQSQAASRVTERAKQVGPAPKTAGPDLRRDIASKHGWQRLHTVLNANPGGADTDEYDQYILDLKPDLDDPEFSNLLGVVQKQAAEHLKARQDAAPKPWSIPEGSTKEEKLAAEQMQKRIDAETSKYMTGRRDDDIDAYKRSVNSRPIIKGMPLTAADILSEAAFNSGGDADATNFVDKFAHDQNLDLDYDSSRAMIKTGEYAYVGQVDDSRGGPGFKRDAYLYLDDASAAIWGFSPGEISTYQEMLGLSPTGVVDPDLQKLWNQAVKQSADAARHGKKVEVRFLFDQLVAVEVANGGLGRGGGGGGGGGANALTIDDYYFYMMQILGDISGVKS